ncbi:helix-turn-helix domain-containing protein [Cytobacillus firmus]|uniref:XRE family transcriptional regulator n=1 Tax=Cytobacillus firmus DS1 TaxID=1307436 RepID=W7KZ62_CYTFI|nr:helix-turn-helix domain-containing protein [Cytobacillus firmus]EWG08596.1 XRE family transcriptional regulator [Cytobacillus firmus DS1]
MEEYSFGEVLQTLRKNKKFTIREISEGICTDNEYSLFEREKKYPTLDQLYLIAEKLGNNLADIMKMITKSNDNYVKLIIDLINKYKREREYEKVFQITQKEKNSHIFSSNKLKQFLLWNEGICYYYLHDEPEKAVETLYEAIDLTNPQRKSLNESEIEILTSIAMIIYETKDYRKAISTFIIALRDLESLPTLLEPKVKLRILFGLSQALTDNEQYEESLNYSLRGINLCIEEELLYLFAEFHYQSGENYLKLGERDKGKTYVEESIHLCYLTKQTKMGQIIEKELEKMLANC